jgi:hypothetical protein
MNRIVNAIASSPSRLVIVTGSGIEMDDNGGYDVEPTMAHALCAYNVSRGGSYVTTNITDTALLTMPETQPDAMYVAVHGTLMDIKGGRGTNSLHHRPRSFRDLEMMQGMVPSCGRGVISPIPTGRPHDKLEDDDPNLLDACRVLSCDSNDTLLIIGNSLLTSTNGMVMRFLSFGKGIRYLVYVDPQARDLNSLERDLSKYGLPVGIEVHHIVEKADSFVDRLIGDLEHKIPGTRSQIRGLIDPALIRERAKLVGLPPKELIAAHKIAGRVHLTELYDLMEQRICE